MPTAWTNPNRNQQATQQIHRNASRSPRPRSAQKVADQQKSEAVQILENLLEKFVSSVGCRKKDPKGGCFCQAQFHPLSTYVPNCQSCGLVLCSINLPHFLCPFCAKELTDPRQTQILISKLETEISTQVAKEIEQKERAEEEVRRNIESFPTLPGTGSKSGSPYSTKASTRTSTPEPSFQNSQTRKVLSLNTSSRGAKKVTVSTFRPTPPSRPAFLSATSNDSKEKSDQDDIVRIAANETIPIPDLTNCRRWQDPRVETFIYIPPPQLAQNAGGSGENSGQKKSGGKKQSRHDDPKEEQAGVTKTATS